MKLGKTQNYEVKVIAWPSRPEFQGPAIVNTKTGQIVNGPWVEGTSLKITSMPYRSEGECAAASVTTPNGDHHYSFIFEEE